MWELGPVSAFWQCQWKLTVMQYKAVGEYNTPTCPLGCVFSPGCIPVAGRGEALLEPAPGKGAAGPKAAAAPWERDSRIPAAWFLSRQSLSPFCQATHDPAGGHAPERAGGWGEPLHPLRGAAGAAGIRLRCLRGLQEGEVSPCTLLLAAALQNQTAPTTLPWCKNGPLCLSVHVSIAQHLSAHGTRGHPQGFLQSLVFGLGELSFNHLS